MTSIAFKELSEIVFKAEDPEERLLISGVSWQQYEALLAYWGDDAPYRIAYLEGVLEIMSPSRRHELDKKNIARLVEVYLEEAEINFWALGSTTLRKEERSTGKEPDECFCIGTDKEFPDLAIEIVLTSGGIDALEIYKGLGVPEVWFWENGRLKIYYLQENGEYALVPKSVILPDLDVELLSAYVNHTNPLLALKEFRSRSQHVLKRKESP
ncbi:Uma2 family endonuclease [Pannus brasiliensis CCIBt3594]|uniref:Uma2 family endonuclease n=1 Tax=Pannus brasiliensis CCIBt3594 TaxID=1427578 RepID=A0AAW9QVW8_9CHRO